MTDGDWPEVRKIYAEGIATGDATIESDVPNSQHGTARTGRRAGSLRGIRRPGRSSAGPH